MTINSQLMMLTRCIKHITSCEFKDQKIGEAYETAESSAANERLNKLINSETSFSTITDLKSYGELNQYYLGLLIRNNVCNPDGIPLISDADYLNEVCVLRKKKKFDLVYQPIGILTETEQVKFTELWAEAVDDYHKFTYSKVLEYYPNIDNVALMLILVRVVLRFVNISIDADNIGNINAMTDEQVGNYLLSWDMPLIADVTNEQRRKIARELIFLVTNKGNQSALNKIMEVLDYVNVDLYWYLLVVNANYSTAFDAEGNPTGVPLVKKPYFVEIPYKENATEYMLVNSGSVELIPFDDVVKNDPQWKATEEDVLSMSRQFVATKYLGARSTLYSRDLELIGRLYWWLEKFRVQPHLLGSSNLTITNSSFSTAPFFVADLFIAIGILRRRASGSPDVNPVPGSGLRVMAFVEEQNPLGFWNPLSEEIPTNITVRLAGVNDTWKRSDFGEHPAASSVMNAFVENCGYYANCVNQLNTKPRFALGYRQARKAEYIENSFYVEPLYPTIGGSVGLEEYLLAINPQLYAYLENVRTADEIASAIFSLKSAVLLFVSQNSPSPITCFPLELKKRMPAVALFHLVNSHTVSFMGVNQQLMCNDALCVMDDCSFKYDLPATDVLEVLANFKWIQTLIVEPEMLEIEDSCLLAVSVPAEDIVEVYDICGLQYDIFARSEIVTLDYMKWNIVLNPSESLEIYDEMAMWFTDAPKISECAVGDSAELVPIYTLWNSETIELDTWLDPDDAWGDSDTWFTGGIVER